MYIKLILASPASTTQLNSTFKLKNFQLIEILTQRNFNSNKFQIKNVTNWIPDSPASTVPQLNPTFKLKKFSTQINYLKRFKIKSEKLPTARNFNSKKFESKVKQINQENWPPLHPPLSSTPLWNQRTKEILKHLDWILHCIALKYVSGNWTRFHWTFWQGSVSFCASGSCRQIELVVLNLIR